MVIPAVSVKQMPLSSAAFTLKASHLAQACAAATRMTYAVLSLRAALPDRTPREVVMNIVSLAFTWSCCCLSRLSEVSNLPGLALSAELQFALREPGSTALK